MLICNDPDIKNIPDFSKFAQDFVEATSPLIGGRMINIMMHVLTLSRMCVKLFNRRTVCLALLFSPLLLSQLLR